jgi:hypothetical protein
MERLNMTLDEPTACALRKHARLDGKPRAAMARELLREALGRREALERAKNLARDYDAGRRDARELLAELEAAQLDLLGSDDERA